MTKLLVPVVVTKGGIPVFILGNFRYKILLLASAMARAVLNSNKNIGNEILELKLFSYPIYRYYKLFVDGDIHMDIIKKYTN